MSRSWFDNVLRPFHRSAAVDVLGEDVQAANAKSPSLSTKYELGKIPGTF
jgi:hypothetical protein